MTMTIKMAKELVANAEQFEILEASEIAEVAKVLSSSKAEGIDAVIAKFGKLIKERMEIAPKDEMAELVAIENSVKTPGKKKVVVKPNAKAKAKAEEKAQEVQAKLELEETSEEDDELAMHKALAVSINECGNLSELRKLAKEYSVTIPRGAKLDKAKEFVKASVIGYDVLNEYEVKEEVVINTPNKLEEKAEQKVTPKVTPKKTAPKVEESPFPETDAEGRVRVTLADLPKQVMDTPYQVFAYILEKGAQELTGCLVTYANETVVVLLDKTVEIDSVMPLAMNTFSKSGEVVEFDGAKCPVAFYAPAK